VGQDKRWISNVSRSTSGDCKGPWKKWGILAEGDRKRKARILEATEVEVTGILGKVD